MGYKTSHRMVAEMLHRQDYSLQGNKKTLEGADHPDRNAQFEHINARVQRQMAANNPVISVDSKKKELVGNFKNGGREWCPEGQPTKVNGHDFVDPELENWRGMPLTSHEVVVNLIANTTTKTGLKVRCELDLNSYPKGRRVTDDELLMVNLTRDPFHGEWNYTIAPACPSSGTVIV